MVSTRKSSFFKQKCRSGKMFTISVTMDPGTELEVLTTNSSCYFMTLNMAKFLSRISARIRQIIACSET